MNFFSQKVKDKIWVRYKGRVYAMPVTKKSARGAAAAEEEQLIAPFSCKVLKVHVKPGATVKKGDPVLVVEAMKMEYSYASPKDGVIESVAAAEGAIVQQGTPFVRWKDSK